MDFHYCAVHRCDLRCLLLLTNPGGSPLKLRDHFVWLISLALFPPAIFAQTIDDGVMIPSKTVFGGIIYSHDTWDRYWEGPLQRSNGNLGTIKTQTNNLSVNLGILDR